MSLNLGTSHTVNHQIDARRTYLILGAKSRVASSGRFTPEIDDIKSIAKSVLRHRIVPNFNAEAENISNDDIIDKLTSN